MEFGSGCEEKVSAINVQNDLAAVMGLAMEYLGQSKKLIKIAFRTRFPHIQIWQAGYLQILCALL
jgi:hypothetical protein